MQLESISTMTSDFLVERVWDGVKSATTSFDTKKDESNFLRQCIALRRMDWLSKLLQRRLSEILKIRGIEALPEDSSDEVIFQENTTVFCNEWPPQPNPRPTYTGLANITKITKDKHNRNLFELSLSDGKYIVDVPEVRRCDHFLLLICLCCSHSESLAFSL